MRETVDLFAEEERGNDLALSYVKQSVDWKIDRPSIKEKKKRKKLAE